MLEKVKMAAKKLKKKTLQFFQKKINNSKRVKKIKPKREKITAPYKLKIVNIDVWKHLLQISFMSDGFGSIIF